MTVAQGAQIEIQVRHLYDRSLNLFSEVDSAAVKLYDDRGDFNNRFDPRALRTTDSNGIARVGFLEPGFYYVTAETDSLGFITDSISLPENAVKATVELIYY